MSAGLYTLLVPSSYKEGCMRCAVIPSSCMLGGALQVLMVVFEILSSHLHMARWHEAKIDQHTHDLEALQEAGAKMRERLLALDQVSTI